MVRGLPAITLVLLPVSNSAAPAAAGFLMIGDVVLQAVRRNTVSNNADILTVCLRTEPVIPRSGLLDQ